MKKIKKISMIASVIVLATSILSACSAGAGKNSSAKTQIRFATWDSSEDLDKQQELVDQFNDSQDDIFVVIEAYGDDFDTKIAASMGSNDAPDVMYMWNYPAYHGGLEQLDAYIEKEGNDFKEDYYEAMWPYNSIEDRIYGIPVGYTTHVLYYNINIFDEVGISYPDSSWTWNDLREAAKTITEYDDGNTKGFVFPLMYDPYDFEMYLWANDTAFCDAEGNTSGFVDSPEAIEVYSFFQNLEKDGYATIDEKSYGTDIMASEAAAMFINGAWPVASLQEAGIQFGVAEIPMFKDGKKAPSILSSSGLSMSVDSKNKDAAWEFIKFWTGEEANIARIDYELPVLKSVVESQKIGEDTVKKVFYDMLSQSEGYTPASFIVNDWSTFSERIELALEKMWNPTSYADPRDVI